MAKTQTPSPIVRTLALFLLGVFLLITPSTALAATAGTICSQPGATDGNLTCGSCSSQGCVWEATSTSSSTNACDSTTTSDALRKCVQTNKITKDLQLIVNVLSAGVGLVIIGMIILGGIQYSIAGDNPQATGSAKQRISNALIALFAFLFIFAFLQWLIPGGLFG